METVLITGGTGLIGSRLTNMLRERNYTVRHLSHTKSKTKENATFYWNPEKNEVEPGAMNEVDHLVHLAGASIAGGRWTKKRKQELLSSRSKGCETLWHHLPKEYPLKSFISASAIGYYGAISSNIIFTEDYPPGEDFLAQLTATWEQAAQLFKQNNIRTAHLRTGVVLASEGGALPKLARPVKLLGGAVLGTGRQYFPWVHIEDICRAYIHLLEHQNLEGAFNVAVMDDTSQGSFLKSLAAVLNRPLILPHVPGWMLKMLLGEMAEMLLEGSRVSPEKIIKSGFVFGKTDLKDTLTELLTHPGQQS